MNALDRALFQVVNGWPDSVGPVLLFFSEGVKQTGVRVGLAGLFVGLVAHRPTRSAALLAMVAWPLANGFTEALKFGLQWTRPSGPVADLVDSGLPLAEALAQCPEVVVRVTPLGSFGTASSHAANMAAVATVFAWIHGRWALGWVAVAVLTGVSRVYVGVHWPSQVLLGWLCGAVCGTIAVKTWQAGARLAQARRRLPEPPPNP